MHFGAFLARRFGISLLTILGVLVVVFFTVRILPGDPARLRAGPYATQVDIERERHEFGLDRPVVIQLGDFLGRAGRLDFGTSFRTRRPVTGEILDRLPATIELSLMALVLAVIGGVGLGVGAALRQGTVIDSLIRGLVVVGTSTPVFWLGVLLILLFYSTLHVAPAPLGRLPALIDAPPHVTGFFTLDAIIAGQFDTLLEALRDLVLPAASLALIVMAPIANIARASMIDALRSDYVRTALTIGVPRARVAMSDAFWNAMLPVITTVGAVFGYLLGGNVLVEQLFSWPGVGQYAWLALTYKDIESLQGVVLVFSILYISLNVIVDVVYSVVDPRIRQGA